MLERRVFPKHIHIFLPENHTYRTVLENKAESVLTQEDTHLIIDDDGFFSPATQRRHRLYQNITQPWIAYQARHLIKHHNPPSFFHPSIVAYSSNHLGISNPQHGRVTLQPRQVENSRRTPPAASPQQIHICFPIDETGPRPRASTQATKLVSQVFCNTRYISPLWITHPRKNIHHQISAWSPVRRDTINLPTLPSIRKPQRLA